MFSQRLKPGKITIWPSVTISKDEIPSMTRRVVHEMMTKRARVWVMGNKSRWEYLSPKYRMIELGGLFKLIPNCGILKIVDKDSAGRVVITPWARAQRKEINEADRHTLRPSLIIIDGAEEWVFDGRWKTLYGYLESIATTSKVSILLIRHTISLAEDVL